ncbi:unnamed protein product [Closterium sp. NIES-53]
MSPKPRQSRYRADDPYHLVLRSCVPRPPVLLQPPESYLTVFHDLLSNYLCASRPIVSRVLSALVTHLTAPLLSVLALVTIVSAVASFDCLYYAAHLMSGTARSPSSRGALVFPLEVLADRKFELVEEAEMASPRSTGTYAPREWHDTRRMTLAALDFFPSSTDPSLFVHHGSTLFLVLLYVDDMVFATPDQHEILTQFRFPFSKVKSTPLAVDHGLMAPLSDEPFESTGPYPELVGCLMKALDCTWVLRVKTDAEGKLERHKTRLVIKGFQQREGIDFQEVFAPVAKAPTLQLLLAAAAVCGWKVEQMDVKTAFLYGMVDEEIYMKEPEGYDDGSGRI